MGFSLGGLFGGKPPKPPDPTKTADTQWDYTKQAGDTTLINNAMSKTNPFGSSEFQFDPETGLPTGINTSFSGGVQTGVDKAIANFGDQVGGIPSSFDFSGINTGDILSAGMNAYDAYANPMLDRQLNDVRTRMAERGIPDNFDGGSEISGGAYGDVYDAANRSRTNYFGQLYGQLPGMEATMTDTAIKKGLAPGQLAGQSLGLLQGAGSLLPQAQQPQASYGAPDYADLVNSNYVQQMDAYKANQGGLASLLKTGGALLTAPMTGGTSLLGLGMGKLGDMWNSSSLNPASAFSP